MRKLLYLVLVLAFTGIYAQEIPTQETTSFEVLDGYGKLVSASFVNQDVGRSISNEIIEKVYISALQKTKSRLNTPLSFVPLEVKMIPTNDQLIIAFKVVVKNYYGDEQEVNILTMYSHKGVFVSYINI
ncbi:MAG: hypothetical protein HN507_08230 [Flavobacteriaceae bacterium]|jgi:hypothetical protein|nr:hypothetical protein [Flavobacteriaceae bacterium]